MKKAARNNGNPGTTCILGIFPNISLHRTKVQSASLLNVTEGRQIAGLRPPRTMESNNDQGHPFSTREAGRGS